MAQKKGRRASGEGTIYQLPDGRWAAKIRDGFDALGKPRILKKEAQTQREVREWLTTIRNNRQIGVRVSASTMTLGQLLEQWLTETVSRNCKPKTQVFHDSNVKHVRGTPLSRIPLNKLTTLDIQTFLNAKTDSGLSQKSVKHIRDTIRAALNVAVDTWDMLPKNPARKATPGRVEKAAIRVFTPEELKRFLDAVRSHQWEALFTVAAMLGLRRGEALGLRWCDFDAERGLLRIEKSLDFLNGEWLHESTKTTESDSTMPLLPIALAALRRRREIQEEEKRKAESHDAWTGNERDLIFTTRFGTPIHPRNLQQTFDGVLKRSELPKIRLHDLRHTVVTILISQGVPLPLVSRYVRHANIKTTMDLYGHLAAENLTPATNVLDAIFRPSGPVPLL